MTSTLSRAAVVVAFTGLIVACSDDDSSEPSPTTAADTQDTDDGGGTGTTAPAGSTPETVGPGADLSLTLVEGQSGVAFYEVMACGAKDYAAEVGASVDVVGPDQWGVNNQVPVIEQVGAARPDGVILVPNDPTGVDAAANQLLDLGIHIVTADQRFADPEIAASQVVSDDIGGGAMAADALAEAIGGSGKILIISNAADQVGSANRVEGFEGQLANYPDIENLGTQFDNNDVQAASNIVAATLAAHPDLKGVFAVAEQQVEGAIGGVRVAGADADVAIVGYDASPNEVEGLRDGAVVALVSQDPYGQGYEAARQLVRSINGEAVEPEVSTPLQLITTDNVDDPAIARYIYESTC